MHLDGTAYYLKSAIVILLIFFPLFVSAGSIESSPVVNSNTVLSPKELSSAYHRVDAVEFEDGFYKFQLESDIGEFELKSLAVLKKRLNEIKILSQAIIQYENQNEEFSDELRSQLSLSSDSADDFITSPFKTARNLAGQLGNNLDATLDGEDPFVRDQLNKYSLREPNDPTVARHKRNAAFQLGLDMYTSNYKVQSFLNTVAKARASGKVSAGVGLSSSFTTAQNQNDIDKINRRKENYDFLPISELWFANASGSNLHGGIQYDDAYLRGYYAEHNLSKSTVFTKKKIYPVLFCQDNYSTYEKCVNTGTMHFSSSEQLYIKPAVSEQVELGIYGYAMATMVIRNGIIEIAKS